MNYFKFILIYYLNVLSNILPEWMKNQKTVTNILGTKKLLKNYILTSPNQRIVNVIKKKNNKKKGLGRKIANMYKSLIT